MRVLHAIHDFLPRHRAGSEIYAWQLCRHLGRSHEVQVVCAEYDPSRRHGSITRRDEGGVAVVEIVNNWEFPTFEETWRSPEIGARLEETLREFRPDVVHVHNLTNLSLELPAMVRRHGARCVATLHDYTLVCPSGGQRIHLDEEHLCEEIDVERCARCFPRSPFARQMTFSRAAPSRLPILAAATAVARRIPGAAALAGRLLRRAPARALSTGKIQARLDRLGPVSDAVDLFVSPSANLASEFVRLGVPASKMMVSGNGYAPFSPQARVASPRVRFGFVGTPAWHKGTHLLLEAARSLPPDSFEILLFGDARVSPEYWARLERLAAGLPVRFMGAFGQERLGEVYASFDVLVVPSLWYENAPLVIQEAFMAKAPVIGARIGGIPEMVRDGVDGLLFEPGSVSDLARALGRLVEDRGRIPALAAAAPQIKSIERDAADWENRYRELCARPREAEPS